MAVGRAVLKYQRISPKKVKPVMDLIRGKSVPQAEAILAFSKKKAARLIEKVLKAAIASYTEKHQVEREQLRIVEAKVDKGPTMRRIRPAWRGRAVLIRHRTSHITIQVSE